ncbi:MAG: hypothetical protein HQL59_13330, partial [Magnetococcales bacterium]|nr:hypothetical protein [Magnetococcales bacterium]
MRALSRWGDRSVSGSVELGPGWRRTRGLLVCGIALLLVLPGCLTPSGQTGKSQGRLELPAGSRYEGEIVDGKRHGRGVQVWPDGARYEGDFVADSRTGSGEFRWPSGAVYRGEFRDGRRHGRGVFLWPDGSRYEGEFREGEKHGQGIFESGSERVEVCQQVPRRELQEWEGGQQRRAEPLMPAAAPPFRSEAVMAAEPPPSPESPMTRAESGSSAGGPPAESGSSVGSSAADSVTSAVQVEARKVGGEGKPAAEAEAETGPVSWWGSGGGWNGGGGRAGTGRTPGK